MVVANVLYVVVAFVLLERKLSTVKRVESKLGVPQQAEEGAF
jgi:hypothetical protein